jgi:predicted DNA-binding transcriptional regulator AlpA
MSRRPGPALADHGPENPGRSESAPTRLAYRLDELADALGVSRRTIERERSAGRFPKPDRVIGKMPLWSAATIDAYLRGGGA